MSLTNEQEKKDEEEKKNSEELQNKGEKKDVVKKTLRKNLELLKIIIKVCYANKYKYILNILMLI